MCVYLYLSICLLIIYLSISLEHCFQNQIFCFLVVSNSVTIHLKKKNFDAFQSTLPHLYSHQVLRPFIASAVVVMLLLGFCCCSNIMFLKCAKLISTKPYAFKLPKFFCCNFLFYHFCT
jgi:hypothetical protein